MNFFLTSNLNLPFISLKPSPFILTLLARLKSPFPSLFSVLEGATSSPQSLCFFSLNNPNLSETVFPGEAFQPSDQHWICSNRSTPHSHCNQHFCTRMEFSQKFWVNQTRQVFSSWEIRCGNLTSFSRFVMVMAWFQKSRMHACLYIWDFRLVNHDLCKRPEALDIYNIDLFFSTTGSLIGLNV